MYGVCLLTVTARPIIGPLAGGGSIAAAAAPFSAGTTRVIDTLGPRTLFDLVGGLLALLPATIGGGVAIQTNWTKPSSSVLPPVRFLRFLVSPLALPPFFLLPPFSEEALPSLSTGVMATSSRCMPPWRPLCCWYRCSHSWRCYCCCRRRCCSHPSPHQPSAPPPFPFGSPCCVVLMAPNTPSPLPPLLGVCIQHPWSSHRCSICHGCPTVIVAYIQSRGRQRTYE